MALEDRHHSSGKYEIMQEDNEGRPALIQKDESEPDGFCIYNP